jgi:hypothetical protein
MMMWFVHSRQYSKFCSTHKIQILNSSSLMKQEMCPQHNGSFSVLECYLKNISYKMYKNFLECQNKFQVYLESI